MTDLFKYIKADQFFPTYAPSVKNYKHKCRGKNGRGNPISFTPADIAAIRAGLTKMYEAHYIILTYNAFDNPVMDRNSMQQGLNDSN